MFGLIGSLGDVPILIEGLEDEVVSEENHEVAVEEEEFSLEVEGNHLVVGDEEKELLEVNHFENALDSEEDEDDFELDDEGLEDLLLLDEEAERLVLLAQVVEDEHVCEELENEEINESEGVEDEVLGVEVDAVVVEHSREEDTGDDEGGETNQEHQVDVLQQNVLDLELVSLVVDEDVVGGILDHENGDEQEDFGEEDQNGEVDDVEVEENQEALFSSQ